MGIQPDLEKWKTISTFKGNRCHNFWPLRRRGFLSVWMTPIPEVCPIGVFTCGNLNSQGMSKGLETAVLTVQ